MKHGPGGGRLALSLAALLWPAAAAEAACLTYTERVRLEGVLVRKTFPGPPNYESVMTGDRPETSWLVRLARPACVDEDPTDKEGLNERVDTLLMVQLVLDAEQYKAERWRLGRQVAVSGLLFGRHTGHHRTPALLDKVRFEK
jgi:hypothetical protein